MKKFIFILPRQSGKTTKAIYEFIKDPESSAIMTSNQSMGSHILEKINIALKSNSNYNILTSSNLDAFRGRKIKKIILDEYLFFSNKERVYEEMSSIHPEELYVFTTSNKTYDREMFNFIKDHKKNYACNELLKKYVENTNNSISSIEDMFRELYYNFITDSDAKIFDVDFSLSNFDRKQEMQRMLSPERFKIEIENKYLTEEQYGNGKYHS